MHQPWHIAWDEQAQVFVASNNYSNVNLFSDDVLLYRLITDAMDYAVLQEAITLLEDW